MPTGGFVIAADDILVLAVDREQARSSDLATWVQGAGTSSAADPARVSER